MEVKLPPSDAKNLRGSFYELLQDFSTFPAAQNFFLVTIDRLPKKLNDAEIKKLGLRPYNTKMGVDKNKKVYEKYVGEGAGYMFLATGVDTTSEDNNVNSKGKTINGLLPTGPYMENTRYPDNDLGVQFYETNISVIDGIFRPWIQLYSVYGNIDNPVLTANIDIYFLSKQQITSRKTSFKSILFGNPGSSSPVIRKIYKYKDCIPFQINDAGVQEYNGDMATGSLEVKWRFSRYEVQIPHAADPPPAPEPEPKPAIKPQKEDIPDGGEAERLWNEAEAARQATQNKQQAARNKQQAEAKRSADEWAENIKKNDPPSRKWNPKTFRQSRQFSNKPNLDELTPKQLQKSWGKAMKRQEAKKNPLEDANDFSYGETRGSDPND